MRPDDPIPPVTQAPAFDVRNSQLNAQIAVHLVAACGGWHRRKGIPMSDEEVKRAGDLAGPALVADVMRLAVAVKVIDELGRMAVYEQRLAENGLA